MREVVVEGRRYVLVVTSLCVTSILSAFLTYYCFASEAWKYRFGNAYGQFAEHSGFWFEVARVVLYVLLFVAVTYWSFPKEFLELLYRWKNRNAILTVSRCLFAVLAILINYKIIQHHLTDEGQREVESELIDHGRAAWEKKNEVSPDKNVKGEVLLPMPIDKMMEGTRLTYVVFWPYTLATLGVIAPIVGATMFYRGFKDITRSRVPKFSKEQLKSNWEIVANVEFYKFKNRLYDILSRYMVFFIVATIIYVFEKLAGALFNTSDANAQIVMFWWVIFSCPFMVLMLFLVYYETYSEVLHSAPNDAEQSEFRKANSCARFAWGIVRDNPFVMITVLVNGMVLPASDFLSVVGGYLKGLLD